MLMMMEQWRIRRGGGICGGDENLKASNDRIRRWNYVRPSWGGKLSKYDNVLYIKVKRKWYI